MTSDTDNELLREHHDFTWEEADKAGALREAAGLDGRAPEVLPT